LLTVLLAPTGYFLHKSSAVARQARMLTSPFTGRPAPIAAATLPPPQLHRRKLAPSRLGGEVIEVGTPLKPRCLWSDLIDIADSESGGDEPQAPTPPSPLRSHCDEGDDLVAAAEAWKDTATSSLGAGWGGGAPTPRSSTERPCWTGSQKRQARRTRARQQREAVRQAEAEQFNNLYDFEDCSQADGSVCSLTTATGGPSIRSPSQTSSAGVEVEGEADVSTETEVESAVGLAAALVGGHGAGTREQESEQPAATATPRSAAWSGWLFNGQRSDAAEWRFVLFEGDPKQMAASITYDSGLDTPSAGYALPKHNAFLGPRMHAAGGDSANRVCVRNTFLAVIPDLATAERTHRRRSRSLGAAMSAPFAG